MKIEIVEPYGFCSGVRRAINLIKSALKKYDYVYCLGEFIHNEGVVESLKKRGLFVIESFKELPRNSKLAVVIRSHGAIPQVYDFLKQHNFNVIDATCPIVKGIQMLCKDFSSRGYKILIFGDREHEEVKSLIGFSQGRAYVIEEGADLDKVSLDQRTILISQSTKEEEKLFRIRDALVKRGLKKSNFYNTICSDIKTRQSKLSVLARSRDAAFVLGSRNSANTINLYHIGIEKCKKCFLISGLNELTESKIKGLNKIVIATGASTPSDFLKSVLKKIKNIAKRGERNGRKEGRF